jgi:hypothetical protein
VHVNFVVNVCTRVRVRACAYARACLRAMAAGDAKEQPQGRGWQHPSAGGRQQRRRRGGATAAAARGSAHSITSKLQGLIFSRAKGALVSCGMN